MTVQAAELTQALATGAVSAFMTSGATGFDSKVWEQVKYYYDVRAWLPKNLLVCRRKRSTRSISRLPGCRSCRRRCCRNTRLEGQRGEEHLIYKEQLVKNGMKVKPAPSSFVPISRKWERPSFPTGRHRPVPKGRRSLTLSASKRGKIQFIAMLWELASTG